MWRYSRLKAKPLWTKKKLLEKVEQLHFSQQGARLVHGFGQKFEYFNFHHFILGKIKKEKNPWMTRYFVRSFTLLMDQKFSFIEICHNKYL